MMQTYKRADVVLARGEECISGQRRPPLSRLHVGHRRDRAGAQRPGRGRGVAEQARTLTHVSNLLHRAASRTGATSGHLLLRRASSLPTPGPRPSRARSSSPVDAPDNALTVTSTRSSPSAAVSTGARWARCRSPTRRPTANRLRRWCPAPASRRSTIWPRRLPSSARQRALSSSKAGQGRGRRPPPRRNSCAGCAPVR